MAEVHTQWFRTVFFLCVDRTQPEQPSRVPVATGFFVRVKIEGTNTGLDYLVTARHCIEDARAEGHGALYVRFNRKNGPFVEIPTLISDWVVHDRADVAALVVLPESIAVDRQDLESASIDMSPETFTGPGPDYEYTATVPGIGQATFQPSVGHEIYFLGLFTQSFGQERNLPVARFGHISRMPDELEIISSGTRTKIVGYLAEFHSWGGHSGSPVFFEWPIITRFVNKDGLLVDVTMRYHNAVLGLITGHYDIPSNAKSREDLGSIQVAINSGMAIITPAEAIRELLMEHPDLVAQRAELKGRVEESTPTPPLDR